MSDIAKQESRGKLISNFAENSERKKPEKVSIQYFQARLSLLERYWSEFYNAHSKLLEDSKADYFKNKIFDEIESDYIMNVATLQEKIDTLRNNSTAAGSPSNTQSVSSSSSNRRLPVLDVPKFSGKQQDWETFKELFCSIIKDDMKITPVEKLQHLLNCVEGPAASSLKGIKVTGTNFVVAWDKLLRRYDNRRIRLATHLDSLINLKYVSKKSATDINSLLDVADEVEKGLTDLGCPVVHYDIWFVHLITSKLDSGTREDWEISQEKCKTFSTYASLRKFLESRVRSLEQSQFNHSALPCLKDRKNFAHGSSSRFDNHTNSTKTKTVSVHMAKNSKFVGTKAIACKFCSGSHKLKDCDYFKRSTVAERIAKITQLRLCMNCLNKDHRASECPSTSRCFICDERHHVKLHIDKSDSYGGEAPTENVEVVQNKSVYFGSMGTPILLATAQVNVMSSSGDAISVRALIDPGAEASFISEGLANLLCLPRQEAHVSVSGVGATKSGVARMKTYARLSSKINSEFTLLVPMLIMEKLTMDIPGRTLRTFNWSHLSGLALADPHFCKPSRIDCILGADVYAAILKEGVLKGPPNAPVAQETQFGWVLTGLTGEPESIQGRSVQSLHVSLNPSISSLIANFWEIEHIPFKPIKSEEDEFCEALYCTTTFRTPEGRYVVRLPVKTIASFPDSRNIALSCLNRLERRLMKQPNLKEKYSEFLQEYEDLGHMRSVSAEDDSKIYYLPHHSVLGSSGKLRVVFNASQKCGTGISLNDTLYPGPKLQQELAAVICRWRLGKCAFVCDTVKMFRQILVADEDLNLQRILWRTEGSNDLKEFQLLTVTYGTTPAPYLAIRTLLQLAEDEKDKYPDASEILRTQTYVDDILVSSDSLEESLSRRDHLISLLACAGISLSKWSASCSELLTGLSAESVNTQSLELDSPVSTLGLLWYPSSDCFTFKVSLPKLPSTVTKRSVLSEIAKLFDPLGWLGPVIIQGKILLQDLWLSGVDWDTTMPDDLKTRWLSIRDDLLSISKIHIPRWLGVTSDSIWEIHGFCDSSSRAYAASVYVKAVGASPFLLMAKTKVAPLKTLSIPRLELCGALLLATLMHYLIPEMPISPSRLQCWTDSTVVLAWLNKHPSNWTTFVANRVSKIMELLPNCSWNYVSTLENPADCASRGMSSQNLKDFYLWWHGPVWLADSASQYPEGSETVFKTDLEVKMQSAAYSIQTKNDNSVLQFLQRFSSLPKLTAVLAYILRWLGKHKKINFGSSYLLAEEITNARLRLWRLVQISHFSDEIRLIEKKLPLSKHSSLSRLNPFFDDNHVLRLGGRLQYAHLPFDEKHPIILPRDSHISRLLVEDVHRITLHGGPQLMQSHLSRSFWILSVRRLLQSVYRRCVKCTRFGSNALSQQMAPLPTFRLERQRPFALTGLDYAGPFPVRAHKGRGHISSKGYVAIFICMVTRAIHLEVVSDLTTAAFLAAYRRFTSRRGNCTTIYSDNATNFRGAATELTELFTATASFSTELAMSLAREGTSWSFIPPRAPHFGGLWERAVRSFKYHLKRVIGDAKLTFEEFSTLVAQIEACLNSRPLCPLSNDAEDVTPLTPGHFLIGTSLKAPPEPFDETDLSRNYSSRWKHILVMRNHFWMRWRKEVLQQLHQRNKWLKPSDTIQKGDLVLIKDEQQPPTRWPIGRITKLYHGCDGLARVADVRTSTSHFRRPIVKLIKLIDDSNAVSAYSCQYSFG